MGKLSFSLRLQPSLMEELRLASASEGVSLNQLINVAVAEKVSSLRTELYLHERIRRAHHGEALRILDRALQENPPMEGDGLQPGGLPFVAQSKQVQPVPGMDGMPFEAQGKQAQSVTPADLERAGETGKAFGWATPRFGKLKKHLEKTRGR
jgi:hypothetical protein